MCWQEYVMLFIKSASNFDRTIVCFPMIKLQCSFLVKKKNKSQWWPMRLLRQIWYLVTSVFPKNENLSKRSPIFLMFLSKAYRQNTIQDMFWTVAWLSKKLYTQLKRCTLSIGKYVNKVYEFILGILLLNLIYNIIFFIIFWNIMILYLVKITGMILYFLAWRHY